MALCQKKSAPKKQLLPNGDCKVLDWSFTELAACDTSIPGANHQPVWTDWPQFYLSGFSIWGLELSQTTTGLWAGLENAGKALSWVFGNRLLRGGSWRLSPACLTIRARAEKHRLRFLQRHLLGQELHWGTEGRWELGQLRWFPRRQQLQQGQGDRLNALVTNQISIRTSVYVALSYYCSKEYIIFKIKRFFNIDEIVWQLHFPYPIPTTGRIKVFENVSVYLIFPKYKKEVSEREELCDSEHRMTESTVDIKSKYL